MRKLVPLIAAIGLLGIVSTAQAMPLGAAPETQAGIIKVAGGCGPGWHPNPWGRCVPFRGRWGGPPPPRFYGHGPGHWRGGPRPWHRGW